jgi:hypothetical protein
MLESRKRVLCAVFLITALFASCSFAEGEFIYDSMGRRNPFIPLVTPEGRLLKLDKEERIRGELVIEGIIYDKNGRSFAIINATVVGIGDYVGDYQVLKIEKDKVIFIKEGQTKEVFFKKEE